MTQTHSVIMAEAAAMALAAKLMNVLNFNDVCYLSDCSQLVQFLNVEDLSHPPDWRMKAFTQILTIVSSIDRQRCTGLAGL